MSKCRSAPADRASKVGGVDRSFELSTRRLNRSDTKVWTANESAVVICDVWNNHWCKSAADRCSELAPRIDRFAKAARRRGALVIHAPSDTMDFYSTLPQRRRARQAPVATPSLPIKSRPLDPAREAPLPIDDSDGGCDDNPPSFLSYPLPWTSQHPTITIAENDIVSDCGKEIYNVLASRGIRNVFVTGVHTNKCVLARPFGIRQLVLMGFNVVLVRDLTDCLYNPDRRPWVSHDEGTMLVVRHIEKYWCASIEGKQLCSGGITTDFGHILSGNAET